MTEKLYQQNPYIREFEAKVETCRESTEKEGLREIILDRSAFFPEGGGQPSDQGILMTMGETKGADPIIVQILDVQERGEEVILFSDGELPAGVSVIGKIDWERRFDHMQNHTGEHIVSGLIHEKFGYNNVGFHFSDQLVTLDLDGRISDQQLREIELEANQIIWANRPIKTDAYTEAEAKQVDYRSKKELQGEIRVVTIPGADVCACCGTHVRRTGDVGLIRLLSVKNYKTGVRIEMMSGRWAFRYMTRILEENTAIARLLSAKPLETEQSVRHLFEEKQQKEFKLTGLQYERIRAAARALQGEKNVLIFSEGFTPSLLQKLTNAVIEEISGVCIAFTENGRGGLHYVAGSRHSSVAELVRRMNEGLQGKGGGTSRFMQGNLETTMKEADDFVQKELKPLRLLRM